MIDFSGLYRAHAADVHRFVLFLSGDRELAEDLVSETFIRLWNARARVELVTVRAYLFAIARNLHLQYLRGRKPRAPLDDEIADARPGPAARALARDELATTLAALQTLPEMDRAALLMRAGDDLSYEEIAAALGLTPTAARVKVHRARLKLFQIRDAAATPPTAMENRR